MLQSTTLLNKQKLYAYILHVNTGYHRLTIGRYFDMLVIHATSHPGPVNKDNRWDNI